MVPRHGYARLIFYPNEVVRYVGDRPRHELGIAEASHTQSIVDARQYHGERIVSSIFDERRGWPMDRNAAWVVSHSVPDAPG